MFHRPVEQTTSSTPSFTDTVKHTLKQPASAKYSTWHLTWREIHGPPTGTSKVSRVNEGRRWGIFWNMEAGNKTAKKNIYGTAACQLLPYNLLSPIPWQCILARRLACVILARFWCHLMVWGAHSICPLGLSLFLIICRLHGGHAGAVLWFERRGQPAITHCRPPVPL